MAKRVALVTGGSQGIGKAIAERLVNDGFSVALVALEENKLQETAKELEEKGEKLYSGIEQILKEYKKPYHVNHVSSLGSLFFAENEVVDYTSAKASDTKAFADYFLAMLKSGIHLAPSQFEAMFLSAAHTDAVIEETLSEVRNYFMK